MINVNRLVLLTASSRIRSTKFVNPFDCSIVETPYLFHILATMVLGPALKFTITSTNFLGHIIQIRDTTLNKNTVRLDNEFGKYNDLDHLFPTFYSRNTSSEISAHGRAGGIK